MVLLGVFLVSNLLVGVKEAHHATLRNNTASVACRRAQNEHFMLKPKHIQQHCNEATENTPHNARHKRL